MTSRSHTTALFASSLVLSCATGPSPTTAVEAPKNAQSVPRPTSSPAAHEAGDEGHAADDGVLLALLPSAKLDLAQAIAQAEGQGARAISAKFELTDGKLSLSVYTAKRGIGIDAERNVLAELSGDPSRGEWQPTEEIFADAKHLTRAAYHLTLVQRSRMSLSSVIAKALAIRPGQVYSIEPGIHERSPVFHVLVATAAGGHVQIDVESGA